MNWIKFAVWLCGLYAAYYGILIIWDMMRSDRSVKGPEENELTFIEDFEPARPEAESSHGNQPTAMVSSGGVSLQQLFMLAREEAIEFTRPVSF